MSLTDEQIRWFFKDSPVQREYENYSDGQMKYRGYALPGTAYATPKWVIEKYTNDGSGNPTKDRTLVDVAWSLRDTLTFPSP